MLGDVFIEDEMLVIHNNLHKKNFVETSNRQGLNNLVTPIPLHLAPVGGNH
jgi:hypothetical protein